MSRRVATIDPQLRARIVALRRSGVSFDRIAAELNRHGWFAALGGRWYAATVHRVLAVATKERKH